MVPFLVATWGYWRPHNWSHSHVLHSLEAFIHVVSRFLFLSGDKVQTVKSSLVTALILAEPVLLPALAVILMWQSWKSKGLKDDVELHHCPGHWTTEDTTVAVLYRPHIKFNFVLCGLSIPLTKYTCLIQMVTMNLAMDLYKAIIWLQNGSLCPGRLLRRWYRAGFMNVYMLLLHHP